MMSCIVTVVGRQISVNNCYQTSITGMLPAIIVLKIALQERGVYESHKIILLLVFMKQEMELLSKRMTNQSHGKQVIYIYFFTDRSKALKTA